LPNLRVVVARPSARRRAYRSEWATIGFFVVFPTRVRLFRQEMAGMARSHARLTKHFVEAEGTLWSRPVLSQAAGGMDDASALLAT